MKQFADDVLDKTKKTIYQNGMWSFFDSNII